jgi:hypothetical protein
MIVLWVVNAGEQTPGSPGSTRELKETDGDQPPLVHRQAATLARRAADKGPTNRVAGRQRGEARHDLESQAPVVMERSERSGNQAAKRWIHN